jgi:probable rRNA maturation factor
MKGRLPGGAEPAETMSPDPSRPDLEIDFPDAAPPWREALPDIEAICAAAARAAVRHVAPDLRGAELALVLSRDEAVQALNRKWRGRDKATNVLSFPAAPVAGGPVLLGDIVLAFETVAAEASEQGKTLADHVRHLVVHGTLHLFGLDHEREAEAERMERLESEILATLGVADPYFVAEGSHG